MGRHAAPGAPPVRTAGRGRRRLPGAGPAVLLVFADGTERPVEDAGVLAEADRLLGALTVDASRYRPAYPLA